MPGRLTTWTGSPPRRRNVVRRGSWRATRSPTASRIVSIVERSFQPSGRRDVIGNESWPLELVDEPEPLLGEGKGTTSSRHGSIARRCGASGETAAIAAASPATVGASKSARGGATRPRGRPWSGRRLGRPGASGRQGGRSYHGFRPAPGRASLARSPRALPRLCRGGLRAAGRHRDPAQEPAVPCGRPCR